MMDNSLAQWLLELEMEDPTLFPESQLNNTAAAVNFDNEIAMKLEEKTDHLGENNFYQCYSSGFLPSHPLSKAESTIEFSGATKNNLLGVKGTTGLSSSSNILSCSSLKSLPADSQSLHGNLEPRKKRKNSNSSSLASLNWIEFDALMITGHQGDKFTKGTPLPLPQHLVIERKRREDLNHRFLALSKVVPGIKKRDKASILGEAVKYMKELQERAERLEEKNKKKVVESVVFVQRTSQLPCADNSHYTNSDSDDNFSINHSRPPPEIEAKVLERSVLVRVFCENHKGILPTLLTEIPKLDLVVVTSNVMPFGNYNIDITVMAQMGADFCMKTKDIVEHLRLALLNVI